MAHKSPGAISIPFFLRQNGVEQDFDKRQQWELKFMAQVYNLLFKNERLNIKPPKPVG